MMLRLSFDLDREAAAIERAVDEVLAAGLGTRDIGGNLGTTALTAEIVARI